MSIITVDKRCSSLLNARVAPFQTVPNFPYCVVLWSALALRDCHHFGDYKSLPRRYCILLDIVSLRTYIFLAEQHSCPRDSSTGSMLTQHKL